MIDELDRRGRRSIRRGRDLAGAATLMAALIFSVTSPAVAEDKYEGAENPNTRSKHAETTGMARMEGADTSYAANEDRSGRSRPLEPRYQPREPEKKGWYNSDYLFGITRSVTDSSIAPAGKVPLFLLTVPLDVALLPFSLIGGFFG